MHHPVAHRFSKFCVLFVFLTLGFAHLSYSGASRPPFSEIESLSEEATRDTPPVFRQGRAIHLSLRQEPGVRAVTALDLERLAIDPLHFVEWIGKRAEFEENGTGYSLVVKVSSSDEINDPGFRRFLKGVVVYFCALKWVESVDSITQSRVRKAFVYYPFSLFYHPQEVHRWEVFFSYCAHLYSLHPNYLKTQHPFSFAVLSQVLGKQIPWDEWNQFSLTMTHDREPGSEGGRGSATTDHGKKAKFRFFREEGRVIDESLKEVLPSLESKTFKMDDVYGVSLIIAGDEGTQTKAVGHSGIIIWICPREDHGDVQKCLAGSHQHIAFNPMGDTYLYENSPIRKIIAGGFTGDFPIVFQVENFDDYVGHLSAQEKRDSFISPPIVTSDEKEELRSIVLRLQEVNQNLLTRGYKFFTQSCVQVSKNILLSYETALGHAKDHTWHIKGRVLPATPIYLWRLLQDQARLNLTANPKYPKFVELWDHWDEVLSREYHFMFQGQSTPANVPSCNSLMECNLLHFGEDDHLSWFARISKNRKAVKNVEEISPALVTVNSAFQSDILSLKDYVAVPYRQRARLLWESLERGGVDAIQGFYQLEKEVFSHLDSLFEKTQTYAERLGKFVEDETWFYHFRRNLDLRILRDVDQELTPMNLYSYFILAERGRELLSSYCLKYQNLMQDSGVSEGNTFCDVRRADDTTRTLIVNFMKISEQIQDAIQKKERSGLSAQGVQFLKEFSSYRTRWLNEWRKSGAFLDFLSDVYQNRAERSSLTALFSQFDQTIQQLDREAGRSSPEVDPNDPISFLDFDENLSWSQKSSKDDRHQRCKYYGRE